MARNASTKLGVLWRHRNHILQLVNSAPSERQPALRASMRGVDLLLRTVVSGYEKEPSRSRPPSPAADEDDGW